MHPIVPDHTRLHRGDWILRGGWGLDRQAIGLAPAQVEMIGQVLPWDRITLNMLGFYLGDCPLQHQDSPRVEADLLRVLFDCTPPSPYEAELLVRWAAGLSRQIPRAAVIAVCRAIDQVAEKGTQAKGVLPALRRLSVDSNSAIRQAALRAMTRVEGEEGKTNGDGISVETAWSDSP